MKNKTTKAASKRDLILAASKLAELLNQNKMGPDGDGWFTLLDFIKETGMGEYAARARINILRKSGKVEVFDGREKRANGKYSRQVWYRLVD